MRLEAALWYIPSVRSNDDHEAKFPLELARRVVRLLSAKGETVLDCFMGSGTTAVAAIQEGRHYVGIEKMEKYVKLARKNCQAELAHLPSISDVSLDDHKLPVQLRLIKDRPAKGA